MIASVPSGLGHENLRFECGVGSLVVAVVVLEDNFVDAPCCRR